MVGLGVAACGAAGAVVGWWGGLVLCPDWGDIGINAVGWAVGGALVGAVVGAAVGAEVLT